MFQKILIANRGEIACRIMRTAKRLGIYTIGVYSTVDAKAQHVQLADEAWPIGGAASQDSYLNAANILAVAKACGAEAIHPGYGFLAENADFAASCMAAGISFIGPPVEAIRVMGSKSAAKQLMAPAGVPLIPGYHGTDQSPEALLAVAEAIGFPILIKAAAGGGGKGMRKVLTANDFNEALASAKREALASFGDQQLLLERYLSQPRHVEVQIFADKFGNDVYLFERDCSLQRRYQKVVEEAPAPGLSPELRQALGETALKAARAVGYEGAGTVEFLLAQDGSFYFMEMNTRLQVEHPVTEMITGEDLVAWQLQVASGEVLPKTQAELSLNGHAFEARIYAEDPTNHFLPAIGQLKYLREPCQDATIRIDTGVITGDEISIYYDPLIAKLIVWGADRKQALAKLQQAIAAYQIVGVTTNLDFLARLSSHPAFAAADIDTDFISRHLADLVGQPQECVPEAFLIASCYQLLTQPLLGTPWEHDAWRMNLPAAQNFYYQQSGQVEKQVDGQVGEQVWVVECQLMTANHYHMGLNGERYVVTASLTDMALSLTINGCAQQAKVYWEDDTAYILTAGQRFTVHRQRQQSFRGNSDSYSNSACLMAPMPGIVVAHLVQPRERVEKGMGLLVMEAMKMEHRVTASAAGQVIEFYYQVGDSVPEGAELLAFEAMSDN